MQNKDRSFGIDNTQSFFTDIGDSGNEDLANIRAEIIKDRGGEDIREPRTWGAIQAAKLIGRSAQWLRDYDPDSPKNNSGHGRWTLARINEIREKIGSRYCRPEGAEPIVMAFSKLKGGVGNTTACSHFAHYCALHGLRVLAIDFDPQSSLTQVLGGMIPDVHLVEEDLPNNALLNDLSDLSSCVRETYFEGVHLIPSNSTLQDLELELASRMLNGEDMEVMAKERLDAALEPLKPHYDIILIDCAPALGMLTMNALSAADAMINPLRPSLFDRASYVMFTSSLSSFYEYTPKPLKYFRILVSQYEETLSNTRQENDIRRLYGQWVLTNKIIKSAEIGNAAAQLSTVYEIPRATSSRETYNRAMKSLDNVYGEILDDFKEIWAMEAKGNGE